MIVKKYQIMITVLGLSLLIMACGLMQTGKTGNASPSVNQSSESNPPATDKSTNKTPMEPSSESSNAVPSTSDQKSFPLPPDTKIISSTADIVTAQVKMSSDDVVAYYRNELPKQGLSEDQTFTRITKPTFNLEFKGSKNGKMLIIQGTEVGDGSVAFSIRYE